MQWKKACIDLLHHEEGPVAIVGCCDVACMVILCKHDDVYKCGECGVLGSGLRMERTEWMSFT